MLPLSARRKIEHALAGAQRNWLAKPCGERGGDVDCAIDKRIFREIAALIEDDTFCAGFIVQDEELIEVGAIKKRRNAERAGTTRSDDRLLRFFAFCFQTNDDFPIN